jgi:hypothetical protein
MHLSVLLSREEILSGRPVINRAASPEAAGGLTADALFQNANGSRSVTARYWCSPSPGDGPRLCRRDPGFEMRNRLQDVKYVNE